LEAQEAIIRNDFERLQLLNFETIIMVMGEFRWGLSPDMEEDQRQLSLDLELLYAASPRHGPNTYENFPPSFGPRDVRTGQFDSDWLSELCEGYPATPGSVEMARQRYYIILWSLGQNDDWDLIELCSRYTVYKE